MNRIYIVTGAAGFLGSTICRQLVNDNQRVRALVLPNDKAAKYLPKEVDIYEGDICNKDSLKDIFNVVFALTGIVFFTSFGTLFENLD